jgi:hypothetical protein
MDSREVRDLMEAYLDVYASEEEIDEATAMAKRGYDETKLRQRAGGGEAADRATALASKETYGDSKKKEAREKLARSQRKDFRNTASSSPGLRGYGYKSNDPAVKAKQAARGAQRGALTPAERKQLIMGDDFANWVDALLDEGYDLSDYTWDEVYEAYTELLEANSGYNMDKINKDPLAAMTPATFLKAKEPGQQFASPRRKGPGGGRIPPSMAPSRTAANVADITRGRERNISRSRRLPTEPKTTKMVKKDGKWVKEAFDIVLAHLVNEGYANDFDSARKIMVNMSEEWIHSIIENN